MDRPWSAGSVFFYGGGAANGGCRFPTESTELKFSNGTLSFRFSVGFPSHLTACESSVPAGLCATHQTIAWSDDVSEVYATFCLFAIRFVCFHKAASRRCEVMFLFFFSFSYRELGR